MKSLVRALRTTTNSLFPLLLLASTAAMAMETTKKSIEKIEIEKIEKKTMAVTGQLDREKEDLLRFFKIFKPKTLEELSDEYNDNNFTFVIPNLSLENTVTRVLNIPNSKEEEVAANFEELVRAAKNGAKQLDSLANCDEKKISELAETAKHPDVVDIIKYLCLCSCNIRPDETCFSEGIVYLKPGTSYCENLRTFLTAYRTRVEKENITQKSSINILIEKAQTAHAFRLMCITITKTNQELLVPFLDKFNNFHITVPKDTSLGIRIKPERLPKTSIFNKIVTKTHATANAKPEYNKETDVPEILVKKFKITFPKTELEKNKISDEFPIGAMYRHIIQELQNAAGEEKYKITECLAAFEGFAARSGLNHLPDRIGSEIILGEEELFRSYFGQFEEQIISDTKTSNICGLFLKFMALRKNVRDYVISKKPSAEEEKMLRSEINDFFVLVNEKTLDLISNKNLRSYLFNTGATLKYLATHKEEILPNAPTTTLQERLVHPVFEIWYQKQLDLKEFIKNAKAEALNMKSKELATATDNALSELAQNVLEKYKNDLTIKYDALKLGVLQKSILKKQVKNEDIFRLSSQIYNKLFYPISRLIDFPKTTRCLSNLLESLVGTTIENSKKDSEFKKGFTTLLSLMKTDIVNTLTLMGKEAEKNGYVCSVGDNGRKIISECNPGVKKMPGTIKQLKVNLHIFNSKEALKQHIENLYKSVKK